MKTQTRIIAGTYIKIALWRIWTVYKNKKYFQEQMQERKLKQALKRCIRSEKMGSTNQNTLDLFNDMSR
jgi:hypothetical protein